MKLYRILRTLFYRRRFSCLLIMVMQTFSMMLMLELLAMYSYTAANYRAMQSPAAERVYIVEKGLTVSDFLADIEGRESDIFAVMEEAEAMEGVEGAYTAYIASPVSYQGERISALLYDPELTELFPNLGLSISRDEEGVLLGNPIFRDAQDTVTLTLGSRRHTETYTVAGRVSAPYRYLAFYTYSTKTPTVDDFFAENPFILMAASQERLALLREHTIVSADSGFVLLMQEGATEEQTQAVVSAMGEYGMVYSLTDILSESKTQMLETLKTKLPMPLFLLLAATVAYFSSLALTVKRSERVLAVYYLCGLSRRRGSCCAALAGVAVALVPTALCIGAVFLLPVLEWKGLIDLDSLLFQSWDVVPILLYFGMAVGLSFASAALSLGRHTPVSYLRGGNL